MKRLATPLALLVLLLAATWPLVRSPLSSGFGLPGMEAVDHLWALWAAGEAGPLIVDSALINYPTGYRWVLADPLNLPWFVLGDRLGGPGLGWNLVAWAGLVIGALAASLWARTLAPDRPAAAPVAAAAALTLSPMTSSLHTGMSEVLTMGWAALALWSLWTLRADASWWRALGSGVLCGLTLWGGPYTALYAALAAPILLLVVGWQQRSALGAWAARVLAAATAAGLLAAPVVYAVVYARPKGLPGSDSSLPMVLADPGAAKNLMLGAEPLALLWPLSGVEPKHAVFLGTVLSALALLGALRRRAWAPLAAAVWLCVLGLGFVLQSQSSLVTWGDRPLGLPALWLSELLPPLGRAARWHRAVIPAGLILAGLAGVGAAELAARSGRWSRPVLWGLAALMAGEGLFRAPLGWPRPTFPITPPSGYAALSEGAILSLPLTRFSSGDPDQLRSPSLLWQASHGHPLGGNPRQPGPRFRDPQVAALGQRLLEGDASAAAGLAEAGFVWIIVQHPHDVARVQAALGEPDVVAEGLWAWQTAQGM
jgi:hypothetical protein